MTSYFHFLSALTKRVKNGHAIASHEALDMLSSIRPWIFLFSFHGAIDIMLLVAGSQKLWVCGRVGEFHASSWREYRGRIGRRGGPHWNESHGENTSSIWCVINWFVLREYVFVLGIISMKKMSVLCTLDVNLVVNLCTDYTRLVFGSWVTLVRTEGSLLGTQRGKLEWHVGAPSYSLQSAKLFIVRRVFVRWLQNIVPSIPGLFWQCWEPVGDRSDFIEWCNWSEWYYKKVTYQVTTWPWGWTRFEWM